MPDDDVSLSSLESTIAASSSLEADFMQGSHETILTAGHKFLPKVGALHR